MSTKAKAVTAIFGTLLTLGFAGTALADTSPFRIDAVMAHTRDGSSWQPGQPVLLMFDVSRTGADLAFPETGLAVVMQVNRERTKCLDVPLKLLSNDGGTARYAGIFYPFSEARFDGRVAIGDVPQDFSFAVAGAMSAAPIERSAEVPAAEPPSAPAAAIGTEAALQALPLTLGALLLVLVPFIVRRPRQVRSD